MLLFYFVSKSAVRVYPGYNYNFFLFFFGFLLLTNTFSLFVLPTHFGLLFVTPLDFFVLVNTRKDTRIRFSNYKIIVCFSCFLFTSLEFFFLLFSLAHNSIHIIPFYIVVRGVVVPETHSLSD